MKNKNKMWTAQMLLNCVVRSDIKTSWQIKDNLLWQHEHAKIVALLKAFDLYVEEKQPIFDKNHNKISEEQAFDISDFLNGNFIRKRSKKDVAILFKELTESRIIKSKQPYQRNIYSLLCEIFKDLIVFRRRLQQSINCIPPYHISQTWTLYSSMKLMEQQAAMIDSILLKIIGDKIPVSEKVLIKKYGFPKDGLLTGNKSLAEILAMLE